MQRRELLATIGAGSGVALAGCLGICGEADPLEESDIGNTVERSGEVSLISTYGGTTSVTLSGGVSADLNSGAAARVRDGAIETGDCATVSGRVVDQGAGPKIVDAGIS